MYTQIIRPILFLLAPEKVHHLVATLLKIICRIPGIPYLIRKIYAFQDDELAIEVAGLKFPNRVGLAAGFDKNATLFKEFKNFGFGHIEIGTVTPLAQPGNLKPRSFRLKEDQALINRMGFNNKGLDAAINRLKNRNDFIIGGNIGKNTATPNINAVDDYEKCFEGLYNHVDYFVVNVSCPNISNLSKLQDQDSLEKILSSLTLKRSRNDVYKPIFLKISPDLNYKQVDETLLIVDKTKIDGLVVSNTTVSRDGLVTSEVEVNEIGNGGLSGKPIRERSTEMIRYISNKTGKKLPIIGVGGVLTAQDAIDKIEAGASLVQIYTGFIYSGPALIKRINKALLKKIRG